MPKKPKKFGIKVWVLCESTTTYCLQFQVYTGKVGNSVETNLGYCVVFDLLADYLKKGHHVHFDNFYTSVKLVEDLVCQKTFSCGTIRCDRKGLPSEFKGGKLKKGDTWESNGITAVMWQDKWTVHAISSIHGREMTAIPQRRGEAAPVMKPILIADYNMNMNGVDKCYQYPNSYSLGREANKWWKKVFSWLLQLAIIDSMVLFFSVRTEFGSKKNAYKKYKQALGVRNSRRLSPVDF